MLYKSMTLNNALHDETIVKLCELALKAGHVAMHYFKTPLDIYRKSDGSKASIADQETEKVLIAGIKKLSSLPIISEEDFETNPIDEIKAETYWLLDPIDGTSSFLDHKPEFTVNIGLIHQNFPVLGVIYAPATDELYFTSAGKAYKKQSKQSPAIELSLSNPFRRSIRIILGHSSARIPFMDQYLENLSIETISYLGSSLKFCRIAEGVFDLYPKFGSTKEWDTAAAQAILEAAGGQITDFHGERLSYSKPHFKNPFIKAFGYIQQ